MEFAVSFGTLGSIRTCSSYEHGYAVKQMYKSLLRSIRYDRYLEVEPESHKVYIVHTDNYQIAIQLAYTDYIDGKPPIFEL